MKIRIFLDVHDGRETESALVERLAEIGSKHTGQDAPIYGPEEFLVGRIVNLNRSTCIVGGLNSVVRIVP
jgi:hypothetical protein